MKTKFVPLGAGSKPCNKCVHHFLSPECKVAKCHHDEREDKRDGYFVREKSKPRPGGDECLLKALLSSCQVNKVGCLVTNDMGGFFGGLSKQQERELIKIKESMK